VKGFNIGSHFVDEGADTQEYVRILWHHVSSKAISIGLTFLGGNKVHRNT